MKIETNLLLGSSDSLLEVSSWGDFLDFWRFSKIWKKSSPKIQRNFLDLETSTSDENVLKKVCFNFHRNRSIASEHSIFTVINTQTLYKTLKKLCQFCSKPIVQPSQKDKFPAQGLAHRRAKQRPNLQGDMCICSAKNESKLICAVCNFDDVQSERPPTDYQSK